MPLSLSDILADETTAHVFALLRVSAGMRGQALAHIEELLKELRSHSEKYAKMDAPRGRAYLALEKETDAIVKAAYATIEKGQLPNLEGIARAEGAFVNRSLNKAVGVDVFTKTIDPRKLEAIVAGKILDGHSLSEWWAGQAADVRRRFSGEMAKGILLGEGVAALTKRVIGTDAVPGGIGPRTRSNAETLVRTSVMAVSNGAKIASFQEMETVKGLRWLSTLDSRTTQICIALDGKEWRFPDFKPIGHDKKFPGPTAHPNCRSTQTAVTYTWSELAKRKVPELDNRTLQKALEDKLEAEGASGETIAGALANARASIDGPVRASMRFEDWAEGKPPEYVASIIGPGRYDLWNSGKITFSQLTDQTNRPLTIAELEAFAATGKPPPETTGRNYMPYVPSNAAKVAKIQELAEAARLDAQERERRADRIARDTLDELATTNAGAYGGPYTDGKAALERDTTRPTAELRDAYDAATRAAAPQWLNAWKAGYSSPHLDTPVFTPSVQRAWETYAKGQPETVETWQAMKTAHDRDNAPARMLAAVEKATTEAGRRLEKLQAAILTGDARAVEAATLDLQAAIEQVRSITATEAGATAQKAADIRTVAQREAAVAIEAKLRGGELTAKQKRAMAKFAATDSAAFEKLYDEIADDVLGARRVTTAQLIEEARRLPIRAHAHPVADAFDASQVKDHGRRAELQHALDTIARVHGDGVLPKVPIKNVREWYDMAISLGESPYLDISDHEQSIAFTFVHEAGHGLDWYAFGKGKEFGSEGRGKDAAALREAIKASPAYARVKELATTPAPSRALTEHQKYLALDREIFARAYSQYIAVKSNDPLLLRQLRADQRETYGEAMYWTDSEFQPIFDAFDATFRNLNW